MENPQVIRDINFEQWLRSQEGEFMQNPVELFLSENPGGEISDEIISKISNFQDHDGEGFGIEFLLSILEDLKDPCLEMP